MNFRKSPIAGSWYAGTEASLKEQIRECSTEKYGYGRDIATIEPEEDNTLLGVISPHAGYLYSGQTATRSYAALKKFRPDVDVVIVIGPDHYAYGTAGINLCEGNGWETPFGFTTIDQDCLKYAKSYDFAEVNVNFDPYAHTKEHSIEIQLPMLQYIYGKEFTFFPIMLTYQRLEQSQIVGEFIANYIKESDRSVAVVASSDL